MTFIYFVCRRWTGEKRFFLSHEEARRFVMRRSDANECWALVRKVRS